MFNDVKDCSQRGHLKALNRFLFNESVHIESGERGVNLNDGLSQTA